MAGISNERIGDALKAQGDLDAALRYYNANREIFERLAKSDPGNNSRRRNLSVASSKVGRTLLEQGNFSDALASFRVSLSITEELAKTDPGNARWQVDLAIDNSDLAQMYTAAGDNASALRHFKISRDIMEPFARKSGNIRWLGILRYYKRKIIELEIKVRFGSWTQRLNPMSWRTNQK